MWDGNSGDLSEGQTWLPVSVAPPSTGFAGPPPPQAGEEPRLKNLWGTPFLSRLRGRGTTRSVVEGGATSPGLDTAPYRVVHIPLHGSYIIPDSR